MINTKSYVRFCHCQIRFQSRVGRCEASEWTRKVQSIFSHFVRKGTSDPSKMVWLQTTRIVFNKNISLSIFFHYKSSKTYLKYLPRTLNHPPMKNIVTMAPPPIVQNHANTWWEIVRHWQKKYWQIAGVSARWLDATAEIKDKCWLKKHTFYPWAAGQRLTE